MSELGSLLELLGPEATLKIVEEFGGTRMGVPKEMPAQHRLRDLLGDGGFALLFQYFGGAEILVPTARRWRIEVYTAQGMKPREVARRANCHERWVHAYLARRGAERQMNFAFAGADAGAPAKALPGKTLPEKVR